MQFHLNHRALPCARGAFRQKIIVLRCAFACFLLCFFWFVSGSACLTRAGRASSAALSNLSGAQQGRAKCATGAWQVCLSTCGLVSHVLKARAHAEEQVVKTDVAGLWRCSQSYIVDLRWTFRE